MGEQVTYEVTESSDTISLSQIPRVAQLLLASAEQSSTPGTLSYPELVGVLGQEELFGIPFHNWAMEQILDYFFGFTHYSPEILARRGITRTESRQRKRAAIDTWLCNVEIDSGDTIQIEIRLVGRELWVRSHILFAAESALENGATGQQLLF